MKNHLEYLDDLELQRAAQKPRPPSTRELIEAFEIAIVAFLRRAGVDTTKFAQDDRFLYGGGGSEWRSNLHFMRDELERLERDEPAKYSKADGGLIVETTHAIVNAQRRSDTASQNKILRWAIAHFSGRDEY